MTIKKLATQHLIEHGLPSKKEEAWRYTNLKSILSYLTDDNFTALSTMAPKATWMTKNVELHAVNSNASFLLNDVIRCINIAGGHGAIGFTITKATPLVELENIIDSKQHHSNLQIESEKSVEATIIEKQQIRKGQLASTIIDLDVAEEASINYIIVNKNDADLQQLKQFNAILGANSCLNLFIVNLGAENSLLRQEINIKLKGSGAHFNLRTINLLNDASHIDIYMQVEHLIEATTSREMLRNVLFDKAFGAFQGIIKVNNLAQKTEAKMSCNTLLLSKDACFNAKPELEIFADDVICGHGATIASINEEALFYLTSRGIDTDLAKTLLIKAFVNELLDDYEDIAKHLTDIFEDWASNFIKNR